MATAPRDLHWPEEMTAEESQRVAAGINQILKDAGYPEGQLGDWWNLIAFKELGGRTPTRAWLDGDHDDVRRLIEHWYAETIKAAAKQSDDESFITFVRSKIADLDSST